MSIRITHYGKAEVIGACLLGYLGCLTIAGMAIALEQPKVLPLALLPLGLAFFVLNFFRDPVRIIPDVEGALVSPADGVITDIEEVYEGDFLESKALKVSMFLSAFDVHLNRAPVAATVVDVRHREGQFLGAMSKRSAYLNEQAAIALRAAPEEGGYPLLVKQIAGVLARRIVTDVAAKAALARGQVLGMIKFGSRTEVYVPAEVGLKLRVQVGDRVKGGETVLGFVDVAALRVAAAPTAAPAAAKAPPKAAVPAKAEAAAPQEQAVS